MGRLGRKERIMTDHDIERLIQCITCSCDLEKCGCTEADEDENGMCTKWKDRKEE